MAESVIAIEVVYAAVERQQLLALTVPDSLMVIATGVVSVTVPDAAGPVEAGRMGPGEIMGGGSDAFSGITANPALGYASDLIKGGGAALTREKIVAAVAKTFICIADASKLVPVLGAFPLPVEVIPMARSHVARELVKLGGDPVYREGVVTDNGNIIIDVFNMQITNPVELERHINNIVGVVTNGLFAARPADLLLLGTPEGVKTLSK